MSGIARVLDRVFREEAGQVRASLIGALGDFDLAEDVLQDAFRAALETWPERGLPLSPGAWLMTTARRKALDRLRHLRNVSSKAPELQWHIRFERVNEHRPDQIERHVVRDDLLRLIFTCCHPALAPEAQVALTLHTLGRLKTPEIARAFLVSEAALSQRLVRAKHKIRSAKIPYVIPDAEALPERCDAVLAVIYLIFNEGYLASHGTSLLRRDLCDEALRLGSMVTELLPDEPEPLGLHALMLLHDARRASRVGAHGELIALDQQDRSLWDRAQIRAGADRVERALRMGRAGPYQLQAAIAALHAEAASTAATDWQQIGLLYDELYARQPTAIVALNRIVAWSMAEGASVGRMLLEKLQKELGTEIASYLAYHLVDADLHRRTGAHDAACRAYATAHELADNDAVRQFIARRRAELGCTPAR